jgi:ligand-binding SRPBCC domain-containing protein
VGVAIEFECVTFLKLEPAEAFDASLNVDVHTASLARTRERATSSAAQTLGLGDEVTWHAQHFGLPWTMTSQIVEWDRPRRFVDRQQKGPFVAFRHEHLFEPHVTGTRMTDRIQFTTRMGVVGIVAVRVVLGRYVRKLIETRNRYLADLTSST